MFILIYQLYHTVIKMSYLYWFIVIKATSPCHFHVPNTCKYVITWYFLQHYQAIRYQCQYRMELAFQWNIYYIAIISQHVIGLFYQQCGLKRISTKCLLLLTMERYINHHLYLQMGNMMTCTIRAHFYWCSNDMS